MFVFLLRKSLLLFTSIQRILLNYEAICGCFLLDFYQSFSVCACARVCVCKVEEREEGGGGGKYWSSV